MALYDTVTELLARPGVVGVLPTDTVYGVVARAADGAAVERLYQLKRRERKPGTLIAANVEQLVNLGIKKRYLTPVSNYWPGAVSVVIPCGEELEYLHQGIGSIAVRIPDNAELVALLQETGPILTSSANQPGEPPANTVAEARAYFGDQVDFYIDGGNYAGKAPSTVLRVTDDAVEVLRQGAVRVEEITGHVLH